MVVASDLNARLWRERSLLSGLLYRLTAQRTLLQAGESRWQAHAAADVEAAVEAFRVAELDRDMEIEKVAVEWGAPEGATLRELIDHAPSGAWRDILSEHLAALGSLVSEIAQVRDDNQAHLRAAINATQEAIAGLGFQTGEYTADGRQASSAQGPRLVDTSL